MSEPDHDDPAPCEFNEEERERIRKIAEVCRATPIYDGALTEPLFPGLIYGSKK